MIDDLDGKSGQLLLKGIGRVVLLDEGIVSVQRVKSNMD